MRWDRAKRQPWQAVAIEKKQREIANILYRNSPAGEEAWSKHWSRYDASRKDEKFQAFKHLIPGLARSKRGRKPGRSLEAGDD